MLFMVIERFEGRDMGPVYRRLAERGRMLPDGVRYVTSWVAADSSTCWQVMECDERALLDRWMANWDGTGVTFEAVVPVVTSAEARAAWEAQAGNSSCAGG
jgi:hypothetical protein